MSPEVRRAATEAARAAGIEPAPFLALIAVESAGDPFWTVGGQKRPPIRFEGHKFHDRLKGAALERAVREGLAHPEPGGVSNPSSGAARYDMFRRAADIDRKAAIESTSWGLGQIMGFNWRMLGFDSPAEVKARAESGVAGQIDLIVRYVQAADLADSLNRRAWREVGRGYNGPAYAKHGYHRRLAKAYRKVKRGDGASDLEWAQRSLKKLGYAVGPVDGIEGPKTEAAVRAFQADHGLVQDGKVGPIVREEIEKSLEAKRSGRRKKTATAVAGGGAAAASQAPEIIDGVSSAASEASGLRWSLEGLGIPEWAVTAVVVVAVGFLVWRIVVRIRE